jgi:hypothetical protein
MGRSSLIECLRKRIRVALVRRKIALFDEALVIESTTMAGRAAQNFVINRRSGHGLHPR